MANDRKPSGPRTVALMGPYLSGKTSLLEAILLCTGAIERKGSAASKNMVGDSAQEARDHSMSTEVTTATTEFMGESFTFLDCPGSIEFLQETINVRDGIDAAIVVCEPDTTKVTALQPILKALSEQNIPHLVFVNKIDTAEGDINTLLQSLQPSSDKPLVLRQLPIWENGIVTGFVDLALERAFVYREHAPSEVIDMPGDLADQEQQARYEMLEKLADYDDHLMEELLEDVEPPLDEIFGDLQKELTDGLIVPVLMGSAEKDNGIRRLLKSLRHDVPEVQVLADRLGIEEGEGAVLRVLKTYHSGQGGKLTLARVLSGAVKDGETVYRADGDAERISGLFSLCGQSTSKVSSVVAGDTVALGRMASVHTGDTLTTSKGAEISAERPQVLPPVYGQAIQVSESKDEVKLATAVAKICDEDPSISVEHNGDTQQMILWGQGPMHLRVAAEKLKNRSGLSIAVHDPKVPYKEAIRKPITQRSRYKKQSGGHGQYGDVVLDIKPLPRGSGFQFEEKVVGGVVPRQYIPSVEIGVKDFLQKGPLGFPVVDLAVTLTDGSHHSVDSSDMAFRAAGRLAMSEALPQCQPVLLEPIMHVEIFVPSEATAKVNSIVSTRRGQILGFDTRPGWAGWDVVSAHMPQSELHSLIVDLRSASQGVGTYRFSFDHMQELTGKLATNVLNADAA